MKKIITQDTNNSDLWRTQTCANCKHYHSYYCKKVGYRYRKLSHGFCYSGLKAKKEDASACALFSKKENLEKSKKEKLLHSLEMAAESISIISEILQQ